jgi:hypothetical protein
VIGSLVAAAIVVAISIAVAARLPNFEDLRRDDNSGRGSGTEQVDNSGPGGG